METIQTDVLIIGGGGAGLCAALAAKEQGSEVLLVSKTPIGKSTCTFLSVGFFSLAGKGVSPENHLAETLKTGKDINSRELAEVLVKEAPERVREVERLGLAGQWHKGGFSCLGRAPVWGADIVGVLIRAAQKEGVSFLPWIMI